MRRTAISLVVLALVSGIVFFCLQIGPNKPASSSSSNKQQAEGKEQTRQTTAIQQLMDRAPGLPPAAPSIHREEGAAKKQLSAVYPPLTGTATMRRVMEDSDPGARDLFQSALESVDRRDFAKARALLHQILSDYGWECDKNKLAAPAYWAIGLTYYREGGEDGLSSAGTFFQSFPQTYPNCEPKELAQAAQVNLSVVYMDQMASAPRLPARVRAAQNAATALKAFLEKWPDSPEAPAAGLSLAYVQGYLANSP